MTDTNDLEQRRGRFGGAAAGDVPNDGPSSHDTAGEFPADELDDAEGRERRTAEAGPSSHDTAGQFPADEVAGDTPPASTSTEPEPAPAPADTPPQTPPPAS